MYLVDKTPLEDYLPLLSPVLDLERGETYNYDTDDGWTEVSHGDFEVAEIIKIVVTTSTTPENVDVPSLEDMLKDQSVNTFSMWSANTVGTSETMFNINQVHLSFNVTRLSH